MFIVSILIDAFALLSDFSSIGDRPHAAAMQQELLVLTSAMQHAVKADGPGFARGGAAVAVRRTPIRLRPGTGREVTYDPRGPACRPRSLNHGPRADGSMTTRSPPVRSTRAASASAATWAPGGTWGKLLEKRTRSNVPRAKGSRSPTPRTSTPPPVEPGSSNNDVPEIVADPDDPDMPRPDAPLGVTSSEPDTAAVERPTRGLAGSPRLRLSCFGSVMGQSRERAADLGRSDDRGLFIRSRVGDLSAAVARSHGCSARLKGRAR